MPRTQVLLYAEDDGESPVVDWLRQIRKRDPKGFVNCLARVEQLQMFGYELRRPAADYLEDGIYELRAKHRNVQYRLLYFFHGENVAVIDHGIIKEQSAVPTSDLKRAKARREKFEQDPDKHTFQGEIV